MSPNDTAPATSSAETALDAIKRVSERVGAAEFSRMSGVPYTTIKEAEGRGFSGKPIDNFRALAAAAERYERENPPPDGAGAAGSAQEAGDQAA